MNPNESDLAELGLVALPSQAQELCEKFRAPPRLVAHLTLVHDVATRIVGFITDRWSVSFDSAAVLFGAATHDIGKAAVPKELVQAGDQHEVLGRRMLIEVGVPASLARFSVTHATWSASDMTIEDLLVTLADKVWKGKRVEDLELELANRLEVHTGKDRWTIYTDLASALDDIADGAAGRMAWQGRFASCIEE